MSYIFSADIRNHALHSNILLSALEIYRQTCDFLIKLEIIHGNKTLKCKTCNSSRSCSWTERRLAVMARHDNKPSNPSGPFSIPDN